MITDSPSVSVSNLSSLNASVIDQEMLLFNNELPICDIDAADYVLKLLLGNVLKLHSNFQLLFKHNRHFYLQFYLLI